MKLLGSGKLGAKFDAMSTSLGSARDRLSKAVAENTSLIHPVVQLGVATPTAWATGYASLSVNE